MTKPTKITEDVVPGFLDAAAILSIVDVETENVYVPEWKTSVRVRSISAAERENLMKGSVVIEGKTRRFDAPQMRVKIVGLAVVNEEGTRLFNNTQIEALGRKNAKAIDRIADVAMRLAGMDEDGGDDDTPLPETGSDDSNTGSRSPSA